jgi:hypothetical protein
MGRIVKLAQAPAIRRYRPETGLGRFLPVLPKPFLTALLRVSSKDRAGYGAYRGSDNPVGLNAAHLHHLVDTGVIRAESIAASKDKNDLGRRPVRTWNRIPRQSTSLRKH